MEMSKAEIEDQVNRILKLVKNKANGVAKNSKRDSELVGLIKNFHNQYQSLYSQHYRLKGELGKKSRGRKDKGLTYSPYSSSDSEYYSSEEIEINNTSNLRNADQKTGSRFEQELKISDLRNELISTTEEREALNSKYQEALSKIQAVEVENKKLRDEVDERQREISALVNVHGSEASVQMKDLEGQLSNLKLELGSLHDQKRDLEVQYATKANEAKLLGQRNKELLAKVSELELTSKEKENEVSQIEVLKSQVSYLQQEVDSLGASKEQATEQVRGLVVQVDVMKQDLVSLTSQKNKLELLLKRKTKEISEYRTQVKTLKEKLTKKTEVEHRMLKEKEGFLVHVKELELELESLCNQKKKLEEQIDSKIKDGRQLKDENERLHAKISLTENELSAHTRIEVREKETSTQNLALKAQVDTLRLQLENLRVKESQLKSQIDREKQEHSKSLTELEQQNIKLTNKTANQQKIMKNQEDIVKNLTDQEDTIKSLKEQVDKENNGSRQLREENERLHAKISQTENELSACKRNFEGREKEASTQNLALKAKIDDLQLQLDNLQLKESQLKSQIGREKQEHSKSLTELEQQNVRLTNEIADQQKIMKNQEVTIKNLTNQEETIKNLTEESTKAKRQILGSKTSLQIAERKMTELAEDFRKRLEDNIRVLFRRIQVAEQLHNETKDGYKKALEQLEESNGLQTGKCQSRKMRDVLELGEKALSGMQLVAQKLEANGELSYRLSKMSDEIALAKNWVTEMSNYKERLHEKVQSLIEKLDDKEEQESLLREVVSNLEAKLGKQGGDRLNMMKTLSDLEKKVEELENRIKEQDSELSGLEELKNRIKVQDAELLSLGELKNRIKEQDTELSCLRELENGIKEKEAGLLSLGEEKREAIRQLCLFIDYQRSDCDYLKAEMAKTARTRQQKT